ncbi:MAG: QueT transporter family protein [Candidatus Izemoplasmatales bacterium]
MTIKKMTKMAIVIALYVVLTYVFSFMAYQNIQFRIAEILVLLCFYKKDYAIPLIIACAISNIPSTLGIIDVVFGTMGTAIAVLGIVLVAHFKNKFRHVWIALLIASMFPVIANGFFVGLEYSLFAGYPFVETALSVAFGEFVVISFFGVIVFTILSRNKFFMQLITTDLAFKSYDGEHDGEKQ